MTRGKYSRKESKGLSKIQLQILEILDPDTSITGGFMRDYLNIPPTKSNLVSFGWSLRRLRKRNLIDSLGRNSKREHLWVRL